MGAEDNGGRGRAGAGYLEQGPAKSAEEVVIGLLGDAFSEARRGMRHGRFARSSEIADQVVETLRQPQAMNESNVRFFMGTSAQCSTTLGKLN